MGEEEFVCAGPGEKVLLASGPGDRPSRCVSPGEGRCLPADKGDADPGSQDFTCRLTAGTLGGLNAPLPGCEHVWDGAFFLEKSSLPSQICKKENFYKKKNVGEFVPLHDGFRVILPLCGPTQRRRPRLAGVCGSCSHRTRLTFDL